MLHLGQLRACFITFFLCLCLERKKRSFCYSACWHSYGRRKMRDAKSTFNVKNTSSPLTSGWEAERTSLLIQHCLRLFHVGDHVCLLRKHKSSTSGENTAKADEIYHRKNIQQTLASLCLSEIYRLSVCVCVCIVCVRRGIAIHESFVGKWNFPGFIPSTALSSPNFSLIILNNLFSPL